MHNGLSTRWRDGRIGEGGERKPRSAHGRSTENALKRADDDDDDEQSFSAVVQAEQGCR